HAYHAGVLKALAHVLAWDPRDAELVLGTSAGAQVGALLRAGMSADDLAARAAGDPLSPEGAAIARHYTRPPHDPPALDRSFAYRPASPKYLLTGLTRPWAARPACLVSALLPRGRVCLMSQAEALRRLFGDEWPSARLWITAVCLDSGEVFAFGREDAPRVDVGTAVACSGAVPAICAPVQVGGRAFVDGGIASATNLALLERERSDLVIVSSPLSMIPPMRLFLWSEVRRLRARGQRVIVLEPTGRAAAAMGLNPMDLARSTAVVRTTYETMLRVLEERRREFAELF
ncbi:MAG TPA: patatin-like phospholipase family protein, partial [Sandaracinaceae bacterium]